MLNVSSQITEKDIAYDSLAKRDYYNLGFAGFDSTATNGFYIQDSRKGNYRLNFGVWTTPRYTTVYKNNTSDSDLALGFADSAYRGQQSIRFQLQFGF